MSEELGTASIERLLADTRAALGRITAVPAGAADPAGAAAPRTADGRDRSERVTATVAAPGRVVSIAMDPRLLRDGSEAVCEAIADAVNDALGAWQAAALADLPQLDTASMAADLERLQHESLTSASSMFSTLQDVMSRLERRD